MRYPHNHYSRPLIATGLLQVLLTLASLFSGSWLHASEDGIPVIQVKLGDYRFTPKEIQINANQPAILHLVNTDSFTPHNFTMEATSSSPAIDVDLLGDESVDVRLPSLPPGKYTFYCANKLLFMKSHRERGMEGTLVVGPE